MERRTLARALLLIMLTLRAGLTPVAAQGNERAGSERSPLADRFTAAQAQADFDVLRRALEEAHGALYRFSTKAELGRRFDAYRARLSHEVTRQAFIGVLSEMLADVRDGHSRLEYDSATATALAGARLFPLRVLIEDSRLMVLSNDTPGDSTIRPGMEVLSINGHAARDLLRIILPRLSGDGFIATGKRARLGRSLGQNYWLFIDQADNFRIKARFPAGKTVTATLAGVLTADRDKNRNPVNAPMQAGLARIEGPRDNVSLRFLEDQGIAYLRVRAFGGATFPASIDTAFRTLRERNAKVLLLDLRANGGGVDEYGALLVSQFTDQPFRYFDRIHVTTVLPSFSTWRPSTSEELRNGVVPDPAGGYLVLPKLHSGVGEQPPGKHPFLGKAFVLLDGGTFSTAADVTAVLRHMKRATFVGEESGGAYEGNTSGLNVLVTLPNSRLRLRVQMYGYSNAVSGGEKGRGTLAEYAVAKTTADLLRGVDAPLERALALARAALVPESIAIPAPDSGVIQADLYGAGTRGLVLVAHGGYSYKARWEKPAQELADSGFRVLAFDTRAAAALRAGRETPCLSDAHCMAIDVLAAVRYLRERGASTVSVVAGSAGGGAAAQASVEAEPGEIDRLVLLAPMAIAAPERIKGRKLFITSRDDRSEAGPRLPGIRDQYTRAPQPKQLVILPGSAHGQLMFEAPEGKRLLREILRFLTEP